MNIVADENVEQAIVARLRQDGYQVWFVAESSPGIADDIVLQRAIEQQALLLTADKDFGELVIRRQLPVPGVILMRLEGLPTAEKATLVAIAVQQHAPQLTGSFTVISPQMVRIRRIGP